MSELQIIAEFNDYVGFMMGLRKRANDLQVARGSVGAADLSGLPTGYVAKLLGPRPIRRVGMKSLGPLLGMLQARMILVVDEDAVRRFGKRVEKRNDRFVRGGTVHIEISHRKMKRQQRKGGQNSRKYMSPKRARQLARNAAHVRWDRVKAVARGEPERTCTSFAPDSKPRAARARGSSV